MHPPTFAALPPPIEDVEFDHAASAAAIHAATRAIAALDAATSARQQVAVAALRGAEGRYAVQFREQLQHARQEADSYRSWLERVRAQVADAADAAAVEQVRRRALRGELGGHLRAAS